MPEGSERLRRSLVRAGTVGALLLSAYYLTFGGEYSLFDVRELRDARDRAAGRVDSLQAAVDSLALRADSLESDTLAIERVARERHGFLREGERVYRFVPDGGGEPPGSGAPAPVDPGNPPE